MNFLENRNYFLLKINNKSYLVIFSSIFIKQETLRNMKDFFTISELILLNQKGLFPGPKEKNEEFISRVAKSVEKEEKFPDELLSQFDINPNWIDVIYSNDNLSFCEGACTWIWDEEVQVQLKKCFKKFKSFCLIYSKKELLMHEAIHACRMKFLDSDFEEILAYQTSNFFFRRYIGPLFQSPRETLLTILFFLLGLLICFYSFFLGSILIFFLPIFYFFRLRKAFYYFNNAKKKIYNMTGLPPLWILLRLSGQEIKMFAVKSETEINQYISKERMTSLRWKQLYFSYFV